MVVWSICQAPRQIVHKKPRGALLKLLQRLPQRMPIKVSPHAYRGCDNNFGIINCVSASGSLEQICTQQYFIKCKLKRLTSIYLLNIGGFYDLV